MQIGNYHFGGGAYDLAVAERAYRRAVAIDPKVLWGHYQIARIIFVKGDFEGALNEFIMAHPAGPPTPGEQSAILLADAIARQLFGEQR